MRLWRSGPVTHEAAVALRSSIHKALVDPQAQAAVASGVVGAVAGTVGGGATGLGLGVSLGAALGVVPALFTMGPALGRPLLGGSSSRGEVGQQRPWSCN